MRLLVAGVAIAAVVFTQAASAELGGAAVVAGAAEPLELSETHIGGVPVFNYDQAYGGQTDSDHLRSSGEVVDTAAHESWIIVLEPGERGDAIKSMCSLTKGGCTVTGENPRFPFIGLRCTEEELASVVESSRGISSFIDVDLEMSVPLPEFEVQAVEGTEGTLPWNLRRIGVDKTTLKGAGVHVYVTDSGIRTDHVEFGGRAVPWIDMWNEKDTPTRFCNESSDENCARDVYGHGTHCAGIIAGETFGVAPQAVVYAAKTLGDANRGPTSNTLFAMDKVALWGQRPAVVSASLGGTNKAYKPAVDALVYEGVTVVVSAGNNYNHACTKSPAFVPSAITVGATDSEDARAYFSNYGACVDIWAPGLDILSCDADRRNGRDVPNNASTLKRGTSMACPHVSGAAALLLGEDSTMSPREIRDRLRGNALENYLEDLSPWDENLLLYVGSNRSETRQQPKDTSNWPSEEFFQACRKTGQRGPRGDYPVCMCRFRADWYPEKGTMCYDGFKLGCPIGAMEFDNDPKFGSNKSHWYYEWNCTTCSCLEEAPQAPQAQPGIPYLVVSVIAAVVLAGVAFRCYSTNVKSESLSDPMAVEVTA